MNTLKKANKPKFFKDETKEQMVRIIREQSGLKLPALVRATKDDIEELAKALEVNANYEGGS